MSSKFPEIVAVVTEFIGQHSAAGKIPNIVIESAWKGFANMSSRQFLN